jgi:hypothetical protein
MNTFVVSVVSAVKRSFSFSAVLNTLPPFPSNPFPSLLLSVLFLYRPFLLPPQVLTMIFRPSCVCLSVRLRLDFLSNGVGRGAWGVGRGAWGVGRGAWGVGRGAWGVGRGETLENTWLPLAIRPWMENSNIHNS